MNQKEQAEALEKQSKENKTFNDVFHVLATRQRTGKKLTLSSLIFRMRKEGFKHEASEYEDFLKFLGRLGFGKVIRTYKGKVKSLQEINTTLQSIGETATSGQLLLRPQDLTFTKQVAKKSPFIRHKRSIGLTFSISDGKKTLSMPITENLNPQEITDLVSWFKQRKMA